MSNKRENFRCQIFCHQQINLSSTNFYKKSLVLLFFYIYASRAKIYVRRCITYVRLYKSERGFQKQKYANLTKAFCFEHFQLRYFTVLNESLLVFRIKMKIIPSTISITRRKRAFSTLYDEAKCCKWSRGLSAIQKYENFYSVCVWPVYFTFFSFFPFSFFVYTYEYCVCWLLFFPTFVLLLIFIYFERLRVVARKCYYAPSSTTHLSIHVNVKFI